MWTDVISEEFWAQGEFEIELGFKPERMLERQDTATKHGRFAQAQGTALSGSISTVLTLLSWICAGISMCGALPSPVCA